MLGSIKTSLRAFVAFLCNGSVQCSGVGNGNQKILWLLQLECKIYFNVVYCTSGTRPAACGTRRPQEARTKIKVRANKETGPNYRVPYNTNVNAAPRIQLPPFLQSSQQQPALTITPAVEGAFKATGRTVVITGGSQGIGRAAALVFARKGYNVVVAARDESKLGYVVEDCAQAAGRAGAALAVPTDVTHVSFAVVKIVIMSIRIDIKAFVLAAATVNVCFRALSLVVMVKLVERSNNGSPSAADCFFPPPPGAPGAGASQHRPG
ncbi:hypothetical protein Vafri_17782 [Volvox africanus]|uniref:Uncharacterized protein n=1 Tax=Volvox africanus TaxID=51714 RepID=A0A8J4F7T5_9CHLO|nr:hypothetical protein Vafri_17782 [Volvox africanus]